RVGAAARSAARSAARAARRPHSSARTVAATVAALHRVERAVEVDLGLAAVGLGDGHLVAMASEVGRHLTRLATAGGLDGRGLRFRRRRTRDGLLGALVRSTA